MQSVTIILLFHQFPQTPLQIIKIYAIAYKAKDIRPIVQKLNRNQEETQEEETLDRLTQLQNP